MELETTTSHPAPSGFTGSDKPMWEDYSRCVRCGLCLNSCPTYRELGVEMDSPRGRIYQMIQVDEGRRPLDENFVLHIDRCLDCRACETACPSGVEYGKLVEAARAQIELQFRRPWLERTTREIALRRLITSNISLKITGALLGWYQDSWLQGMLARSVVMKLFPRLAQLEKLAPRIQSPSFFSQIGKTFPAQGTKRFRVALHSGCIANLAFARLHEATIRVLQANGCEVVVPKGQVCCGALPAHAGMRGLARELARKNIAAIERENFDAILTNAAGCGSTLKEYGYLLKDDPEWSDRANAFSGKMADALEFLGNIGLVQPMRALDATVTYQDSCHLAHGQKIRQQPRALLKAIPGIRFVELPLTDLCCGSAGIYNITQTEISMQLLRNKMESVNATRASIVATANPGCMLQLEAGAKMHGSGQRVVHIVELLDEALRTAEPDSHASEPRA